MEHPKIVQRGPQNRWFVTHPWLETPLGPFDTDEEAFAEARKQQEIWDNAQGSIVQ